MDFSMKILIVDDFASMRRIIKGSLHKIGYTNVIEAEDGDKALKKLQEEKIGLIMCDWNMPNMTGIEVLKRMRSDEKLKNTPFIMVTAEGQKENVLEAIHAGANHYIIKPFTPETLSEKIKLVLKKKG